MGVSWDPQDEEFTSSKNIFLLKIAFDAQFFRRGKSRSPMVLINSTAYGLIGCRRRPLEKIPDNKGLGKVPDVRCRGKELHGMESITGVGTSPTGPGHQWFSLDISLDNVFESP